MLGSTAPSHQGSEDTFGQRNKSLEAACTAKIAAISAMASGIDSLTLHMARHVDATDTWLPGDLLQGTARLIVRDDTEVMSLKVEVTGEGSVQWEEQLGGRRREISAREKYVDETAVLAEGPTPSEPVLLQRGTHKFGFKVQLPRNLPTSYIGQHGSVTYVVKAILHEARRIEPVIISEPFFVCRPLEIEKNSLYASPIKRRAKKSIASGSTCFIPGKVRADLLLNRRGHVAGGDVTVSARVRNSSGSLVTCMSATVERRTTFYAHGRENLHVQPISRKVDPWEMAKGEGRQWRNVRLNLPGSLPPSHMYGCELMDVVYDLVFQVTVDTEKKSIEIRIPLLIGTQAQFTVDVNSGHSPRFSSWSSPGNSTSDDDVFDGHVSPNPATHMNGGGALSPNQIQAVVDTHVVTNGHHSNGHVTDREIEQHTRSLQQMSVERDLASLHTADQGATAF